MTTSISYPIITIDGPSGSGKGTVAQRIAQALDYNLLDSGALYRIVGYAANQHHMLTDVTDNAADIAQLATELVLRFEPSAEGVKIYLDNQDITSLIRNETVGGYASQVAQLPEVRQALLQLQQNMATPKGLVADGRDMGTVVFPEAATKFYLTADVEIRAQRRYEQLQAKDKSVKICRILSDLKDRDDRDSNRSCAPLKPAEDAIIIDSSGLDIDEVVEKMLSYCQ